VQLCVNVTLKHPPILFMQCAHVHIHINVHAKADSVCRQTAIYQQLHFLDLHTGAGLHSSLSIMRDPGYTHPVVNLHSYGEPGAILCAMGLGTKARL